VILIRWAEMEENEIERIIIVYETELRYLAYRYVRDWILVDDIMQEVYLKIFLKLDTFNRTANIKTWLYKITCNQCIDFLRSKVIKSTILIDNLEEFLVSNCESAEREVLKSFDKGRLYRMINSLPDDYKETLTLYYFNNYSYKEICSLLSKDISYVKNKLFRGRRLLKEIYYNNEQLQDLVWS
jgi:RNA polymerase sigma-70 factor, ECF subfamily